MARAAAVIRSADRIRSKYAASSATDRGASPRGMPTSSAAGTCSATYRSASAADTRTPARRPTVRNESISPQCTHSSSSGSDAPYGEPDSGSTPRTRRCTPRTRPPPGRPRRGCRTSPRRGSRRCAAAARSGPRGTSSAGRRRPSPAGAAPAGTARARRRPTASGRRAAARSRCADRSSRGRPSPSQCPPAPAEPHVSDGQPRPEVEQRRAVAAGCWAAGEWIAPAITAVGAPSRSAISACTAGDQASSCSPYEHQHRDAGRRQLGGPVRLGAQRVAHALQPGRRAGQEPAAQEVPVLVRQRRPGRVAGGDVSSASYTAGMPPARSTGSSAAIRSRRSPPIAAGPESSSTSERTAAGSAITAARQTSPPNEWPTRCGRSSRAATASTERDSASGV